ncbi:unnamed protein product (macronuclear) [Paramecium tetraurelia]|uniref:Zinc finger C3HC4 RING-type domain-containing protein n=1 Tax=Paramecium tetraurelia TaxID=5888 RepID=A0CBC3_PARTE|nr:uncharacterized protein GSPATT00036873001 [Paramecium tetraurelia]CAK68090.1 unnamed protein product [Paramecium tetraurelia]|eukprot:XP_001435487.1 hypothetical protein (macronuclear) [Paramecium tetraurelia strain d4-2]
MNETQDSDTNFEVACSQCQTTPDNYVKLDCDHKFCLVCLAYNYLQSQQQNPESQDTVKVAICSKCQYETHLDPDTIEAIQYVIKEIIIPLIEQNQEEHNVDNDFDLKQSETIRESKGNFTAELAYDDLFEQKKDKNANTLQFQKVDQTKETSEVKDIKKNKESLIAKTDMTSALNERVQLYLERLDKSFKNKFESIRDIQDQKFQFQQKCQSTRDEISQEFQKQVIALEQKKNSLINEVNALETQQLLEIQKQENEYESQIQLMAKYQEELRNLKGVPEDMSKFLIEIEKIMTAPSQSLQIKSSLLTSQRQLIRIQSLTQSTEERLTSDSKMIPIQQKFSPIKNDRTNEIWNKLNESDKKSRLKESSISQQRSNQKSRWKETILEIFDKKEQSFERYSTNNKYNPLNRPYNIHQVLNMQQQSFQIQKENLLKR